MKITSFQDVTHAPTVGNLSIAPTIFFVALCYLPRKTALFGASGFRKCSPPAFGDDFQTNNNLANCAKHDNFDKLRQIVTIRLAA
jgi:hypothetical protein